MKAAFMLLLTASIAFSQNTLPKDASGWTLFTPASDSRIVYVSQTGGNDATAKTYSPGAAAIGNNPFLPVGQIVPFKTIAAAFNAVRDTFPDWVLLKRGETWYESGVVKSGRSDAYPFLFGSYGSNSQRPLLKTGKQDGFNYCCGNIRNFAAVGISFYAQTRDPDSPEFVSDTGGVGFNIYTGSGLTKGILIEDCMFRYYLNNVIQGPGTTTDIVIRRSIIADNYSGYSHSAGLYTNNVSFVLEDNLFDHNGWYKQSINSDMSQAGGQATFFNHNTYFSNSHDVVFRNNLFLRPSSIGNKWISDTAAASGRNITIENNLYVEGELGISMGGNSVGAYRFKNIRIANNVMLDIGRSRPTKRTLGWGLDILDWDGGTVANNYFLHNASDTVNNVHAISVLGQTGIRNITFTGNTIYGMKSNGPLVGFGGTMNGVVFNRNSIQSQGINSALVSTAGFTGLSFSNNSYFSTLAVSKWFSVDDVSTDLAGWIIKSGETGSKGSAVSYPDPNRTVESYHASLGKPATLAAFISEARKQSKANWRREYTAAAANDWIRAGFGVVNTAVSNPQKLQTNTTSKIQANGVVRLYGLDGRYLGSFSGLDHARKILSSRLYIVGSASGNKVEFLNR